MALAEQAIDERGHRGEDRAVLLVSVGRRDEEAAADLVACHVRSAEPGAEEPRAVRLPHAGKTHDDDERRPPVRRRRHRGDLRAELGREDIGAHRVRARLRRSCGA